MPATRWKGVRSFRWNALLRVAKWHRISVDMSFLPHSDGSFAHISMDLKEVVQIFANTQKAELPSSSPTVGTHSLTSTSVATAAPPRRPMHVVLHSTPPASTATTPTSSSAYGHASLFQRTWKDCHGVRACLCAPTVHLCTSQEGERRDENQMCLDRRGVQRESTDGLIA